MNVGILVSALLVKMVLGCGVCVVPHSCRNEIGWVYDRTMRGAVMGSDSPKGMVIGLASARGQEGRCWTGERVLTEME